MVDKGSDGLGWDWVTLMVALLVAVILAMLTFDVWFPHGHTFHTLIDANTTS